MDLSIGEAGLNYVLGILSRLGQVQGFQKNVIGEFPIPCSRLSFSLGRRCRRTWRAWAFCRNGRACRNSRSFRMERLSCGSVRSRNYFRPRAVSAAVAGISWASRLRRRRRQLSDRDTFRSNNPVRQGPLNAGIVAPFATISFQAFGTSGPRVRGIAGPRPGISRPWPGAARRCAGLPRKAQKPSSRAGSCPGCPDNGAPPPMPFRPVHS